jgi:cyclase
LNHRVIVRMDIKGPNLVKGIHLEGLRVLGKPEKFAKYNYEQGADELMFMDVVASLYGRNNLLDIVEKTAKEIFIPLTVGGGIRTIEDIRAVLRAGADKVCINTAAILNPDIIRQAALEFGSSTIVVAIEAIKHNDNKYYAYIDNGREETGVEVVGWAKQVETLGAGEIVLTSVDREGTGSGYDIALLKSVSGIVNIPVIAHGGFGKLEHAKQAIIDGGASALAIASSFHYKGIRTIDFNDNTSDEGNTEFLKKKSSFAKIEELDIATLKNYLFSNQIECRVLEETTHD